MQEFYTDGSEQNTVVNSQMYIGNVLWLLAEHAPHKLKLEFDYERDAATAHCVSSASLLDGCLPDFHATIEYRPVMFGVDKVRPPLSPAGAAHDHTGGT